VTTTLRRLVLWDVDHTLIESRGVGGELSAAAFAEVFGRQMEHQPEVTGKTELAIVAELVRLHNIPPRPEHAEQYAAALAAQYASHRDQLRSRGRALPGAQETLATLDDRPDILQTVASGNFREVAQIKLDVFDLARFLDFELGAYGGDEIERPALVALARKRAGSASGTTFDRTNTVMIGDTVHDVAAGLNGGARPVGVASGKTSADDLKDAGADIVLPDLTDAAAVLAAVTG
jgi:phosphoglycolate phosphatase